MSKKVAVTPSPSPEENERVNPFEKYRLANLQNCFWSPSTFENVNMRESGETPPQDGWTIDQLAVLFPKPIEDSPSSHMNDYPVDLATEAKAQADIDKFFNSGPIAPSPDETIVNKRLWCKNKNESTAVKSTACASTTTDLILPLELPSDLETAFAPFLQTELCCGSEPCIEPSIESNEDETRSIDMEKDLVRRRLKLSFGCSRPQENPGDDHVNSSSYAKINYGDPFCRNHEIVTPEHESFTSLGSKRDLKLCAFTPELGNVRMCSPSITPIRDCDTLFPQASGSLAPMDMVDYQQGGGDVRNSSYTITPTAKREFGPCRGVRRRNEIELEDQNLGTTTSESKMKIRKISQTKTDKIESSSASNILRTRLVLENVFQNLGIASLKVCRLVCKDWHVASLSRFRKMSSWVPINFENSPLKDVGLPWENIHISEDSNGCRVFKEMINKTELQGWFMDMGKYLKGISYRLNEKSSDDTVSLPKILTEWCPNLEELQFRNAGNIWFQSLNLCKGQLPNIKKIILEENSENDQRRTKIQPKQRIQIVNLFEAASNVENVHVDMTGVSNSDFYFVAYSIAMSSKIKSLVWDTFMSNDSLKVLANTPGEMNMKTIRLNCCLMPNESTAQMLFDFLSRSSKTLEALHLMGNLLEIYESDVSDGSDLESEEENDELGERRYRLLKRVDFLELDFPEMPKLTVLELKNIFHCRFNSLDFVLKLPNLKKLVLRNVYYASCVRPFKPDDLFQRLVNLNSSMELVQNPHQKLRELDLHGEIMSSEIIELIATCFPNLKVANLFVNSGVLFLEVFRKLDLEELELRFIPEPVSSCNAGLSVFLPKMLRLKKLKLISSGHHSFLVTKHLVQNSFQTMASIERLEFKNCKFLKEEYEDILERLKCCGLVVFTNCNIQELEKLDASFLNGSRLMSSTNDSN